MNEDLVLMYENEMLSCNLEKYNQMYVQNHYTFFKFLITLKSHEGYKYDEYHSEKFKCSI